MAGKILRDRNGASAIRPLEYFPYGRAAHARADCIGVPRGRLVRAATRRDGWRQLICGNPAWRLAIVDMRESCVTVGDSQHVKPCATICNSLSERMPKGFSLRRGSAAGGGEV
mgnify:CR=1 FL=1